MSVVDAILKPKMAAEGLRPEDGVDDMTHISDIDVNGINTNLKVRFNRNDIYTYTGTILVAVNPYKSLKIYEMDTIKKYSGQKMGSLPPHIFATAEAAYLNVQNTDVNQSCVISGESGAGKTETTKFILQYLCSVTSSVTTWVEQQILEANTILEAFGNAKTTRNDNSSRFGKFMQVCFDEKCEIRGSVIQEYLLEQSRITTPALDERNYHVFYQLLSGGEKERYMLEKPDSYQFLRESKCFTLESVNDAEAYEDLRKAMTVLSIDEEIMDGIFSLVSAVLHIGNLTFEDIDGESVGLTKEDKHVVEKVAKLLLMDPAVIKSEVLTRNIVVRGNVTTIPLKMEDAQENKRAMAKALYSRTFAWLVGQINSTTNPGAHTTKFIGVLDIFGFENFTVNSFEQLCINFTNEKLHKFFNHYVFDLEQAEYTREGIDFSHITFTDNTICLELIEKPPKCVLRLLDEECRFPGGTDESYLQKQHSELSGHVNYIKGADKTRWDTEFGVRHFAGEVTYVVYGFLAKNKDVQQDSLFQHMADSGHKFVRDLTQLQDLLNVERNVIFGNKLRRAKSVMRRTSEDPGSVTRTNKAKPTVGDTFRRQLSALVDVLESTTPWYVRCIKPNATKAAGQYDDELVCTQLQYSGMLDIVRIRKEGFPIHVPAESFVAKYHAMAGVMGKTLSADAKTATREILTFINAPTTEWQIGKTKVFLRNSVFEPLEENLRKLLNVRVIKIQAAVRGFVARSRFLRQKAAARRIQNRWRGMTQRLAFLRQRRAVVTIQAYTRGFFAREVAKEMRRRRKAEEERLRQEEAARRQREAEEAGQAAMEASMEEAKRQLLAMTKRAEQQAAAAPGQGVSDLDQMFNISAGAGEADADVAAQMSSELDAMLAGPPERPAGTRTIRRRRRAEKTLGDPDAGEGNEVSQAGPRAGPVGIGVGGASANGASVSATGGPRRASQLVGAAVDENINPSEFSMVTFAERYFNDHPQTGSGTLKRSATLRRGEKAVDNPVPKSSMLVYSKNNSLPTSLVHMHNPENVDLACSIWKDLNKQLRGELKEAQILQSTQSIIAYCLERPELRDEVYCQLIRQTTNNPKPDQQQRGWEVLALCSIAFPPGKMLYKYLQAYMKVAMGDSIVGGMAAWALNGLRHTKLNGPRRLAPSALEIEAVRNLQSIVCRVFFLDGQSKAIAIQSTWTAQDAITELAQKLGLHDTDGWALFETTPTTEHFVRGQEYIGDILAEWEAAKRSSMQMTKYATTSRRGSAMTQALGGGDARFVFRKRLFKQPREIPTDPVEYGLIYAQAVHSVTRMDEFPVNERVTLQLAGLQAQVAWGDAKPDTLERYEDLEAYLPYRIRAVHGSRTREEWQQKLYEAHRDYGTGMTPVKAKVLYLTAVKQYPLYGGTFFDVQYKGFWSHPARLFLSIHVDGFKFVSRTKEVLAEYSYAQLANVEVNAYEDTVTLNMDESMGQDFMFSTPRKEDVANLIASYSPHHRNWKQVGTAPVAARTADLDNKSRLMNEVRMARKRLAESGMMQKPAEVKTGFLGNTLRRKSKGDKAQVLEDFEKSFPERFWVYQKGRLQQSLTLLGAPEAEEVAVRCFASLLVHAGLTSSGGFEVDGDAEHVVLIQNVIGRCLEKEDVCNEFYLQLIKQTSEQPDANGRINVANWSFFAMTLGVVVPRNKLILNYISAHLRRCSLETATEEGKFAQYCQNVLARTLEKKNRKYPPSRQEILCVRQMRPIHARFHFADGAFRALMFDAAATTAEVVDMIKQRIGLKASAQGFSLFEVFGTLERNMLAWEKVADAIFKWEKYARSTNSPRELQLTFKKRLFLAPFPIPADEVEFSLIFNQAVEDVRGDRFPITSEEGAYLTALQAQVELGDYESNADLAATYGKIIREQLPEFMHETVLPEDVAAHHQKVAGLTRIECSRRYLKFVQAWPLYGATIFEVLQSYTTTLPKNLWLAVNESGIHILRRRTKEPLIAYGYKSIVNYSPSLRNLMIVTESLQRGTKFVFNTSQASQIAHLIKDYTHIIIQKRKALANVVSSAPPAKATAGGPAGRGRAPPPAAGHAGSTSSGLV